jgi:hypothetical protein
MILTPLGTASNSRTVVLVVGLVVVLVVLVVVLVVVSASSGRPPPSDPPPAVRLAPVRTVPGAGKGPETAPPVSATEAPGTVELVARVVVGALVAAVSLSLPQAVKSRTPTMATVRGLTLEFIGFM